MRIGIFILGFIQRCRRCPKLEGNNIESLLEVIFMGMSFVLVLL